MTVEELIEELQQLPGASQSAIVHVGDSTIFNLSYVGGHVFIESDGDDDDDNVHY